ncbi:hypothetical protein DV735_g5024, partial [Chaetothyriales sp. CBS 134920]
MGIPGVLKEIGKGERVALAKLAVEHLERTQRPLRLAIDTAIWNFQTQAGLGGKNPALRTLYYRLLRILALPIHPLFVYDGGKRPLTKRGRSVTRWGHCAASLGSKRLLQHFHFPHHDAPGEAEAECAMLQQRGIVDMVMSDDGDAIMFGSRVTLRDWSMEGTRGNKSPTHVSLLDSTRIKERSGIDPDGMILVALLSGGDYNPDGLPGFGPGLACEIARAGFGQHLLELVRSGGSEADLADWRERLQFELESNESGFFKRRHPKLKIPPSFPDRTLLSYYTNPAVSDEKDLKALEKQWMDMWDSEINIPQLRDYVGQTFDWLYKPGAWKFVRGMAPSLLAYKLRLGLADQHLHTVSQITERRQHFISGGIPELRITAVPSDVVGLDLEAEEDSPEHVEASATIEIEDSAGEGDTPGPELTGTQQHGGRRKSPLWSPTDPEKIWIAETTVKLGAQGIVEEWEELQREIEANSKKAATRKTKPAKSKGAAAGSKPIKEFFAVAKGTPAGANKVAESAKREDKSVASDEPPPSVARSTRAATKTRPRKEKTPPVHAKSSKSIASFFIPVEPEASKASSEKAAGVPPEPSTGLTTDMIPKHILAQSRESLPGTWRVGELEEEVAPPRARRVKRVSFVDLTGD